MLQFLSAQLTAVISIGIGAGNLCEYFSLISLKPINIISETIEITKQATLVSFICLTISITVCKYTIK